MQLLKSSLEDQVIRVARRKLLETLKANRQSHFEKYHEAVAGYKEMAEQKLRESFKETMEAAVAKLDQTVAAIRKFDPEKPSKTQGRWTVLNEITVSIPVPTCHVDLYDKAINMMEWDTRDEIDLPYPQFCCFVQDDWDWKTEFESIAATYSKSK